MGLLLLGVLEMIKNKLPNIRYPVGTHPKLCFLKGSFLWKGNIYIFKITHHFIQWEAVLLVVQHSFVSLSL